MSAEWMASKRPLKCMEALKHMQLAGDATVHVILESPPILPSPFGAGGGGAAVAKGSQE